jgi:hypothetical protein
MFIKTAKEQICFPMEDYGERAAHQCHMEQEVAVFHFALQG